jgi:hypothetical protein
VRVRRGLPENRVMNRVKKAVFFSNPNVLQVVFGGLWLFIVFVAVWDGFLTFVHRTHMQDQELNPIGRALIALDGGGVAYLLAAKLVGTIVVTTFLVVLYDLNPRRAIFITAPVAAFQCGLLLFLTLF